MRVDRIDRKAAHVMAHEYGIDHTGFFFELTKAVIDGFGSSNKLHLSDRTWFAGINFEF